ncbi:hypothetical protein LOD99_15925 [Oopsacas minuta]|uniref:Uncharacterized protein n=1 Tax=Oopsacas minuta TaxID=111878 RepID=A0AAV7K9T4_9METZ|nr:hypothetical protein LOD99_15925 [Oopsacas minuta]
MVSLLESLVGFIETRRTEFEHFHKRGIILCGHDQYYTVLKRGRVPNRRYFDVDDGDKDRNMSPMAKFRQDVFQVINDRLIVDFKYHPLRHIKKSAITLDSCVNYHLSLIK